MSNTQTVRGPSGQVIAYVQQLSEGNWQILDKNQRLVAREIPSGTYDANGRFIGKGRLGLTLVWRIKLFQQSWNSFDIYVSADISIGGNEDF